MSYRVRAARKEDRESAARLMWKAFDVTTPLEDLLKEDWIDFWNQPEKEDWAFIAEDEGQVVGNFCFFASSSNMIRGVPLRYAGVWAVATLPQYRRQGVVRALFEKAFPVLREQGCSLSILDPFYKPFYEKFGYAVAESRSKHSFKPEHLTSVKGSSEIIHRELRDPDEFELIIEMEKSMTRFGSRSFRNESQLRSLIKKEHFHILERNSELLAAMKFHFEKSTPHGINLQVWTPLFKTWDVVPSIIELIRNYAVNCGKVDIWCDKQFPLQYFIDHVSNAESKSIGSMMMRVIDFEKYCESILVPETATESVVLELVDEQCSWNNGIYKLSPTDGKLRVERVNTTAEVKLDALSLSKVISGLTPATMLQGLGVIDCSVETGRKLELIYPADNFVSYLRF